MINERDVIKLLIPYPNINSDLAFTRHYYICRQNSGSEKILLKCQTFKPSMLINGNEKFRSKFVRISSNNKETPFFRDTVVDKSKIFKLLNVTIPLNYLCSENPKCISQNIYKSIIEDINFFSNTVEVDRFEFIRLNPGCN